MLCQFTNFRFILPLDVVIAISTGCKLKLCYLSPLLPDLVTVSLSDLNGNILLKGTNCSDTWTHVMFTGSCAPLLV